MKKLLLVYILCLTAFAAKSQPKPDFDLEPMYLKGDSLKNLPVENLEIKNRVGAGILLGAMDARGVLVAPKETSGVTFSKDSLMVFYIKSSTINPLEVLKLQKAKIRSGNREIANVSIGTFGKMKLADGIKFKLEKYADQCYRIVLESPLEPGEYMFSKFTNGYCFTVE